MCEDMRFTRTVTEYNDVIWDYEMHMKITMAHKSLQVGGGLF